jgi:hypothetical protein
MFLLLLHCMSFDLRLLITPLVSSNNSFKQHILCMGGNKIATGNTHIIDINLLYNRPTPIALNKLALIRSYALKYVQEGLHS